MRGLSNVESLLQIKKNSKILLKYISLPRQKSIHYKCAAAEISFPMDVNRAFSLWPVGKGS